MSSGGKFEYECPHCHKKLRIPVEHAGKSVRCNGCENKIKIPQLPTPEKEDNDDWLNLEAPGISASDVMPAKKEKTKTYGWEKKKSGEDRSKKPVADQSVETSKEEPSGEVAQNPQAAKPKTPSAKSSFDDDDFKFADEIPAAPVAKVEKVKSKPAFDMDLPDLAPLDEPSTESPILLPLDNGINLDDGIELDDPFGEPAANSQAKKPASNPAPKPTPKPNKPRYDLASELQDVDQIKVVGEEFRVRCDTCGTLLYATNDQVGDKIKCSDCHSSMVVPAPPVGNAPKKRNDKRVVLDETADEIRVRLSEPAGKSRDAGNMHDQNASDLLKKAEKLLDEEGDEVKEEIYDFDTKSWLARNFSFLRDPILLMIASFSGLLLGVIFFLMHWFGGQKELSDATKFLLQMMVLVGGGVPIFATLLANGLAVLQASANKLARVTEWPIMQPGEWMAEGMCVLVAFVLAAVPGGAMAALFHLGASSPLTSVACISLTCWILFPPILLSILDNQSMVQPYSPAIFASLSKKGDAWGALYMMTALSAICMVGMMGLALRFETFAFIAGFALAFFIFFLFHLLGILAARISDVTDLGFEPDVS